ncbi:hypothetical protein HZZ13_29885 [Bradyrhizobium sp. CNPSo 4010]|uniref:DUF1835 domain-containing protein n=1 Tax=Bradyrhizobium agreste TaxID=2751811 RepID=A0ABS0PYK8_9BRAD|nr:hypothetical protein [Bradyrhizobium agreste]MBH5401972.1 hypothetical protein [Bradyrhizobium agreste]
MTRLIVTTDSSAAGAIQGAGLADLVIAIERRLVRGPLPSTAELNAFFAPRTPHPLGLHWLDDTPSWRLKSSGLEGRGLIELFSEYDSVELWMEPEPNALLLLLLLLDHCGIDRAAASKLVMRPLDIAVSGLGPEGLANLNPPIVKPTQDHVELAGRAWRAYRAPTPQAWFGLLETDLSLLPQLERCVVDLLEELPNVTSGLGATETRILELIAPGGVQPFDVFPGYQKSNERRVFGYWEIGALLDGLARCERPGVAGLDEGPFSLEMHNDSSRLQRYKQSRLSLTEFGKAVLGGHEHFCCHNRIDRWWGGTHLTHHRLWQWDTEAFSLIEPD